MKRQSKRSFLVFSIILILALNMFWFGFVPNVYATSGTLLPSADTSVKALNPSSGTTHYLLVNDSSDSTYVNALFGVAGSYEDQYNCTRTSLTGTINNVTVYARLKKVTYYGSAKANVAVWGIIRGGSKKTTSTTLTTTIATYNTTYATDPWTTANWTFAGLNNVDFTMQLADATDGESYETYGVAYEIYLAVDYTVTADTTPPTYSDVAINTTNAGQPCNFSVTLTDETGLANYTFGCNNTGQWVNASVVTISGTSYKANTTYTLNSTLDYVIQWEYWFADSNNNLNNTGLQSLLTGAWLYGWNYRKLHTINNAAGAGTNYQIKIIVINGTGIDDDDTVYTNNNTRAYFGDVRFTDDDAFTVLDCWIETLNMGINATFWVEIADDLSTSPVTIYMYYGKSDASTTSHGASTFLYFNDFSTEIGFTRFPYDNTSTIGTEDGVNASGWSGVSSYLQHIQQLNLTHEYALASLSNGNVAVHAKVNLLTASAFKAVGITGRYTVASNVIACYFLRVEYYGAAPNKLSLVKDQAGVETTLNYYDFTAVGSNWYDLELRMGGSQLRAFLDGVERITVWNTNITSGDEVGCYGDLNDTKDQAYDDFYVRKYVDPEPAHGVWGSEELLPGWSGASLVAKLLDLVNNKIDWTESISTIYLGTTFNKTNMADLQNAIAASTDWQEVLQWSAFTMKFNIENETKIKWALNDAIMVAGLPNTTKSDLGHDSYLVYYRGLLYGYYWANKYSYLQDKWNLTTAFNNFASAYNWTGHGFLWYIDATNTESIYYGPRYYDESAETLACFLTFYDVCNVSEALAYAETEWSWINNNLWCTNSTYGAPHFVYATESDAFGQGWECEAGSFLQVIAWLKYLDPTVGNISRLMTDMSNRFIADEWSSPQWAYPAIVVHHYPNNPQRRLTNTVTAWSSLFSMYQLFNETEILNFQDMLNGYDTYPPAWKCLYNQTAGLYDASTETFRMFSTSGISNEATALATVLQFFMGMTPVNATLAVPVEELEYEYKYNMFDQQIFNMSLTTRKVTVGISKNGTINFNFNELVTQMFNDVGLYELTFDANWNEITNCTKIGELPERRYFTLATALIFNPTATINLFDSSTMLKAIGLLTSGTATSFSGLLLNNALGFNPMATINLFSYTSFGKEIATRFSEMAKPFENLGEWKSLPFQVTGAIKAFDSTNMARALGFLTSGVVSLFSSLAKAVGLNFETDVSVIPSSSNYFLKAAGFQVTNTAQSFASMTMQNAIEFLATGITNVWSSMSKAVALSFQPSNSIIPSAASYFSKALGFQTSETLIPSSSNSFWKALGFQPSESINVYDSLGIGKGLGFLTSGTVNGVSTILNGMSLAFQSEGSIRLWDSGVMSKALGFQVSGATKLFDSATMLKALGFSVTNTLKIVDSLSYSFEIFQHIPQNFYFDLTEIVKMFSGVSFNMAKGFSNYDVIHPSGSLIQNKAVQFGVDGLVRLFGDMSLGVGKAFSNFAHLNPFSHLTMNKELGFSNSETFKLTSTANMAIEIALSLFQSFETILPSIALTSPIPPTITPTLPLGKGGNAPNIAVPIPLAKIGVGVLIIGVGGIIIYNLNKQVKKKRKMRKPHAPEGHEEKRRKPNLKPRWKHPRPESEGYV